MVDRPQRSDYMNSMRHLVLGAARSGKTRFALNLAKSLAHASGSEVIYVATAEAYDVEVRERLAGHRAEPPPTWRTLEAPRDLATALGSIGALASREPGMPQNAGTPRNERAAVIVVDC